MIYLAMGFAIFLYSFFILLLPTFLLIPFLIPLMLLFGAVIWALPVSEREPFRITGALFWGYLITLVLWPNYLAIYIPGLPWVTMPRLFCTPLILILLIDGSTSAPFRRTMLAMIRSAPAITYLVVAFAIIQLVSIGFSDAVFITINRVINNQLTWTAIYFVALWEFRKVENIERLMWLYILCVFALTLMAALEAQLGHVFWQTSVPGFLHPPDPLVDEILAGSYRLTGQYRVQGTQTTPLSLAELVAVTIPFLVYFADKYRKASVIAFLVLVDALIIYTLFQADARLGFGSILVGHLLGLAYIGVKIWRERPGSLWGPTISLSFPALAIVAGLAVVFVARVRVHVLGGGQHQGSNDDRKEQIALGLHKIWESPLFGFGADRGGPKVGFYSPGGQLTIDSYYLSILMDYGFLGFFVFYGLFVWTIYKPTKSAFAPDPYGSLNVAFAIFLFEFLIIKAVLSQAANHSLLFLAFAAVVALQYHARRARVERGRIIVAR